MTQDNKALFQKFENSEAGRKAIEAELRLLGEKVVQREFEAAGLKKSLNLTETELAIYREIDSITLETVDIKTTLDRMMDVVIKIMDADAGTLYRLAPDRFNRGLEEKGGLVFENVKGPVAGQLKDA